MVQRLRAVYRRRLQLGSSVALVNGTASVTTSSISAGTHSVYAIFESSNSQIFANSTAPTQSLIVSQAPLTVTADNQTKVYGTPNPAPTFTCSGFVNGDTVTSLPVQPSVTTTATNTSPIGPYPIIPYGPTSDGNYSVTYVNGTLTITQAVLTITANNQTMIHGRVPHADRFVQRVHQRRLDQQRDPIGPHALHSGCGQ